MIDEIKYINRGHINRGQVSQPYIQISRCMKVRPDPDVAWFLATHFPYKDPANKEYESECNKIAQLLDNQFPGMRNASNEDQRRWGFKLLKMEVLHLN